jgi:YD repeat-containing protein
MMNFNKFAAIVLVLLLFSQTLTAYAATTETLKYVPRTIEQPHDISFSAPTITQPQELIDYRTEYSKRFMNPDGTLTEKIYKNPIHYKDSSGKWENIDSTLVENSDGTVQNQANSFQVKLQKKAKSGPFSFSKDGASVSFSPTFANDISSNTKGNRSEYKDITTNTDLIQDIVPKGLKETILIKGSDAPTTFSFEMNLQNLTYEVQKDGSVAFYRPNSTTPEFFMVKPFAVDAKQNVFNDISYKFEKDSAGKTLVTITLDPNWVKDPNRSFPITLDPTMTIQNEVDDTFIGSANPTTNYGLWSHQYIGNSATFGTTRTLIWLHLPSLPSGAVITNSTFSVDNTNVYAPVGQPVVEVHRVNANWAGGSATWSNANQIPIGGIDSSYTATNTAPLVWNMDLTQLTKDWYNGIQPNYGVELKYANETLTDREILANDDSLDPGNHPKLTINYTIDGLGYQPFWTYDGPVNMANQNLVLSSNDIDFPGRSVSVSLDRTYNSRSTNAGVFGYGWNSPLDMKIYVPAKGPVRFIDGDGTVHYFDQNLDGTYASPPGLFWTLTISGSNATITTADKTQYSFTNGQLTKIQDLAGNAVTYSYTGNQVTGIADAAGHSIILTYSNGHVVTATDPANRLWKYNYDTSGNLIGVVSPDTTIVQSYRYDSAHHLIASVTPSGRTTYYAYTPDNRITAINPTNMIINGNFEVDADGSGIPDHFAYSNSTGTGSASIDSTQASPFGKDFCLNVASTNSYQMYLSDPIPVDPAKTYTLSGYVKAAQSSTGATVLSLFAFDGNGVNLGEFGRMVVNGSSSWTQVKATITAASLPAATKTVNIKLSASSGAAGTGKSYWDAIQFEEGSTATAFVAGDQITSNPPTGQAATYDGEGRKHLYTFNIYQNTTRYQQDPLGLNLTDNYTWGDATNKSVNMLLSHQNPNAQNWSFTYDPNSGNVVTVTDPLNKQQTFAWDQNSKLTKYTSVNGSSYKDTNDAKGNNLTTQNPYNTSSGVEYDSYGNVTSETNQLGWADNLIDNSSFELGSNADGTPLNFGYSQGQMGVWSLDPSATIGNTALKISADQTNSANYTVILSDPVTIDPAADYLLAGNLKTINTTPFGV